MATDELRTVKSADRVLDLFELFGEWDREMSHSEIAAALNIPKSSLTQLLRNLVARRWLAYSSITKGYSLGAALAALARRASRTQDLVELSGPVLADLTSAVGESSALNTLKGDLTEVVATVLGPHRLVSHMRLGDVAPLYATSGGKVILAFQRDEMVDGYLARVTFEAATPATIRDARTLRRQIATIRRESLAYSREEWTPGIVGMARPIRMADGTAIGAVNVAMPRIRYDAAKDAVVAGALARVVSDLSRRLGGNGTP